MDNNAAKSKISTYIFMDFETTGLLKDKPRITELCLLTVDRVDMEEDCGFPRVINKIKLCLNPKKTISDTASKLTGLYNDSLAHQKSFTADTMTLINSFINHLNEPVCLLAHYGNGFDFPILVAELERINESLRSSVLCADTLEAFKSLIPTTQSASALIRPSYKLNDIFLRIFGYQPPVMHTAEDDCETLVKIAKRTLGFIEWINDHAVSLTQHFRPRHS